MRTLIAALCHSSPAHVQLPSVERRAVGRRNGELGGIARRVLNEGGLSLPAGDANRHNLTVAVELVPQRGLRQGRSRRQSLLLLPPPDAIGIPAVQRRHGPLVAVDPAGLGLLPPLVLPGLLPGQHLLRDGVGRAVEAILGVLLGQRIVAIARRLVPEGTVGAAVALPPGEEAAQLGEVALVAGLHPGHALQLEVGLGPRDGPGGALLDGPVLLGREPRAVGVALGDGRAGPGGLAAPLLGQDAVPHLHGEAVLEVVDAHLAHVLGPGAVAADLDALQPAAGPGLPREDREGRLADLARLAVGLLRHADVGVIPEARLADEGELGVLPLRLVVVLLDAGHFVVVGCWLVVLCDYVPTESQQGKNQYSTINNKERTAVSWR